LVIKDVLKGPQ